MATKTSSFESDTLEKETEKKSQKTKGSNGKESLKKIFEELLQDTYSAETQIVEALPELAKASHSEDLQEAFETHLTQTKKQIERLEKIFDRLRIEKKGEKCKAMEGLVEEGKKIIKEHTDNVTRDVALIIAAQKVEHYEIAAYGSLVELADVLNLDKVADILETTLEEEKETDELLSDIAQQVNDEAFEYNGNEYSFQS
ncbi:MAG TPA: ferritin-like domain-containing protein [Bacteroidia bacterium]|jgi:ferritin-like metal-binding protein YciE|nr:ferritin-like domain-containing protein [Bacteroidia bacterium]